jgi:hypothetical protein
MSGGSSGSRHFLIPATMAVQDIGFFFDDLLSDISSAVSREDIGTLLHTFRQQHDMLPYQIIGLRINMQYFHRPRFSMAY